MTWLSEEDIAWLKSSVAPHSSTLETWHYAGAYFRSFKASKSGMLEVAYHAIRPGQTFAVTMLTTDAYAAQTPGGDITKTVYHGTSLAGASLIINGGFKPSYGAWRGPQCLRIAPHPGIPSVYTTPHWNTAVGYRGNSTETSIALGPVGMVADDEPQAKKAKTSSATMTLTERVFASCVGIWPGGTLTLHSIIGEALQVGTAQYERLIRRAKNHVSDLKCGVPERIRRPPRLGKIIEKNLWS